MNVIVGLLHGVQDGSLADVGGKRTSWISLQLLALKYPWQGEGSENPVLNISFIVSRVVNCKLNLDDVFICNMRELK